MLSFSGNLKVFVALEPCDMRRSFDGLHNTVGTLLGSDPYAEPSSPSPTNAAHCSKSSTGTAAASGCSPSSMPTEAQWEYACRAGETETYSGGTIDQVAWYDDNSESKTQAVGTKKQNAWGLHDMHGNVREWCADWYDGELSGGTDPSGYSSGFYRVDRGGSWNYGGAGCRAAYRGRNDPNNREVDLGFRPALVPSE